MKRTAFLILSILVLKVPAQENVPLFTVYELELEGSAYGIADNPVRDIELVTHWRHGSGHPTLKVYGFYDGDGKGGPAGNVFRVRLCPVETGIWKLVSVRSNDPELDGQKEGLMVSCRTSDQKGFWRPDQESGNRWYMRSNGEHPYIVGNTFYSFLSEHYRGLPTGSTIEKDIMGSAGYLNKLRFAITGDIFPHPVEKPFLDEEGNPTDNGDFSHRPNPKWFSERVDLAVQRCFEQDVIADLILNGPDSKHARNALRPAGNNHDCKPYLRYIAARYCSYPNVWICLSNEYNIRNPSFSEWDMVHIGLDIKSFLAYPTPLSVHSSHEWNPDLNLGDWNDHIIVQNKLKRLDHAAACNLLNYHKGNRKPVINDELAYEGEGDGWSEEDVIEAVLGAFMGGGYASSGYKPVSKGGHYFPGNFSPEEHSAADNLLWMRERIDQQIRFWEVEPLGFTDATYKKGVTGLRSGPFYQLAQDFRVLGGYGMQYVLATNGKKEKILAYLPEGRWEVKLFDVIRMKEELVDGGAEGTLEFSSPESRAAFFVFTRTVE